MLMTHHGVLFKMMCDIGLCTCLENLARSSGFANANFFLKDKTVVACKAFPIYFESWNSIGDLAPFRTVPLE